MAEFLDKNCFPAPSSCRLPFVHLRKDPSLASDVLVLPLTKTKRNETEEEEEEGKERGFPTHPTRDGPAVVGLKPREDTNAIPGGKEERGMNSKHAIRTDRPRRKEKEQKGFNLGRGNNEKIRCAIYVLSLLPASLAAFFFCLSSSLYLSW